MRHIKRFFNFSRKGFTLIELLVVIAIIGILATLVLVSLNSARDKAKDAAIKGAFRQAKATAELIYSENTYSYVNVCDAANQMKTSGTGYDVQMSAIRASIIANNNGGAAEKCYSGGTAFCVMTTLKSAGTRWCTDSVGSMGTPGGTGCGDAVTHNLCNN